MSYTALLNYPKTLAQYKASMEIALGKQLSDLEFERLWTDQYNAMSTASDYAHYNITKAAIFATDYPPFTFDVIEWIKRKLANQQTGGSDSTREDMAGWLGDATIRTNNGKVAFSPDDYMADLDADNVMNIMKTQNISHSEAEAIYFKRLENGETRAEIFLSHPRAVSLTLPLRDEPYDSSTLFSFFDGLIPEGWLLNVVTRNWKLNRKDRFGLLLVACRDTIGKPALHC